VAATRRGPSRCLIATAFSITWVTLSHVAVQTGGVDRAAGGYGREREQACLLQKCRAILIRYDRNADTYRGLIQLACSVLWYRVSTDSTSRKRVLRSFPSL